MRIVCWHSLFHSKIRKDVTKFVVCCSRDWRIKGLKLLTLCIQETPKQVLLQTVKTQMKCRIMLHFIRCTPFVMVKKIFRLKNTISIENYNLTPLDMYNGLSQVYCLNQKEESISIQRVNSLLASVAS